MNTELLYDLFKKHPAVQTDSRKMKKGELFFALKGENFNGNLFAARALNEGAAYAVIDEKDYEINTKTILVENVLEELQALAKHHREQFNIPVLAITGSNGKTTTKELVHAVLSTTLTTYTTSGNLNNHIGIPLTLLSIKEDAQMAVIEMGANHVGEIASYSEFTLPTHGIITNCGRAHLEGFGSVEAVRKAKGELYDHLRETRGTVFVMWDYDYLQTMSKGISGIIKYGTTRDAHVIGRVANSDPLLEVEMIQGLDARLLRTQLAGEYNLPNVLAAITVGKFFEIPETLIVSAIENYIPSNSRSQLLKKGSNTFIVDAYNANPSSMELAIANFAGMKAKDKVLILGGMAELGNESMAEHQALVELIGKNSWKAVMLVGGDFKKINHSYLKAENAVEAGEWLKAQHFENTYILIKGSRSIGLEKVLEGN